MSVSLAHSGLPKCIGKPGLLSILDGLGRKHLALPPTAFHLLRHFVLRAKAEDFGAGRLCGNWERVEDLATILQVTPRAISLAVQKLEEVGYIRRTTAANGARGASRVGDQLKWLRGISLKPLIEQVDRLKDKHEARQFEQEAVRSLRSAISSLRRQIRQSGDMDALSQSEALLPGGRVSLIHDIDQLERLAAAFGALLVELEADLVSKFSGRSEQTPDPIYNQRNPVVSAHRAVDDLRPKPQPALLSSDYRMVLAGLGSKLAKPDRSPAMARRHGISQPLGAAPASLGGSVLRWRSGHRPQRRLPAEHRYRARNRRPASTVWSHRWLDAQSTCAD
jgi:DNA-binding Lrp family transcriptional regulator